MHRSTFGLALIFGCSLLLGGCFPAEPASGTQQTVPQSTAGPAAATAPDTDSGTAIGQVEPSTGETRQAETLVDGMTLREKVGQLFFVRPDALDPAQSQTQINDADSVGVTTLTDAMRGMLAQYPVGGVVLFGKNLTAPEQLAAFTVELHGAGKTPLLIAVDEEGGTVARLANHDGFGDLPDYPGAAEVAQNGADAVYEMSATIGGYLTQYGIDLDFAPVADVNTNPDNPVIGERAFSADAQQTAEMVTAAVEGFQDAGVLCCLKHYPGHGDTAEDSHKALAVTPKSWQELLACELVPFQAGMEAGADLVMAGHIAAPEVTGNDLPASLSPQLLQSLRQELGFDGVIVTDSLAMEGITNRYTPAQAAVQAVQAGADILLMPDGLADAFDAVVAAVEEGTIPESRIDESATRILALKLKSGLI